MSACHSQSGPIPEFVLNLDWRMGRPTLLDDLRAKRIVDAIAAGASRKAAAASVGINTDTLCTWLSKGRAGEERYAEFAERVRKAEGCAETRVIGALMTAIEKGSVPAMMFWLQCHHPAKYATKRGQQSNDAKPMTAAFDDASIIESVYALHKSKVGT